METMGGSVKILTEFIPAIEELTGKLPDIPMLAKAFGGEGHVITSLDQLDELALPKPGLVILDVRIDPTADVRRSVGW